MLKYMAGKYGPECVILKGYMPDIRNYPTLMTTQSVPVDVQADVSSAMRRNSQPVTYRQIAPRSTGDKKRFTGLLCLRNGIPKLSFFVPCLIDPDDELPDQDARNRSNK